MSVAKGLRQFVIVDRPAALAGRPADWFVGETAAFSYRVDKSANWTRAVGFEHSAFQPDAQDRELGIGVPRYIVDRLLEQVKADIEQIKYSVGIR